MLILAVVAPLLVLPYRFHLFVHVSEALRAVTIYLAEGLCRLTATQLNILKLSILLLLLFRLFLLNSSLLLLTNELKFLVDNFVEFARPKEVLQHGGGELAEEDTHEAEEALADCSHLIAQEPIIKLELLVRGEEAHLGDDQQLEYEGFSDFGNQLRFVLEHTLRYLAEELGLLAEDGPVLFAEADQLLVLHLVLLDGMMQLSITCVLVGGLFLRELDHDETLSYPVQLVFKHDDALKVHLCATTAFDMCNGKYESIK